jgi:hypothetical protein
VTYDLTDHARESLRKRPAIRLEWIERVLQQPERGSLTLSMLNWSIGLDEFPSMTGACCASLSRAAPIHYGSSRVILTER